jgi:hypothetical protein
VIRFAQEQVCDLLQHGHALFRRAALEYGVVIIERGRTTSLLHDRNPTITVRTLLPSKMIRFTGLEQRPQLKTRQFPKNAL